MQSVLKEKEACEFVGVSRATLSRWRQDGNGPPFAKLPTGTIRYRLEDVEAWLEQSVVPTGASSQSNGARTTIRRVRS